MRKIYVESLGCAKNQVDSEVILRILSEQGYERTEDVTQADLVVVNTCGFIESAREESVSTFFDLHSQNPKAKFIMAGCMAQRYADELSKDLPEASAIFGNRDLKQISKVAEEVMEGERVSLVPAYPDPDEEVWKRDALLGYKGSAYLKISEGCNHWCSYCAIPLIRGELRSRPIQAVVDDGTDLANRGIREINLIAQDLAAYGLDWDGKSHFRELLEQLVQIKGNFRVRLLYIHPDFFPDWLPSFVKDHLDKVMPYFDIPLQHASHHVLSSMGRKGNEESYLALVNSIRETLPDAVIRTTIMVGFPGEEAADFKVLKQFLQDAKFDWMGVFCYSREKGTKAWNMRSQKDHDAIQKKAERYKTELEKLQVPITSARLQRFVGNTYPVLIEEPVEGAELAIGRIYAQAPDVDGLTVVIGRDLKPGMVVKAGIKSVKEFDLEAVLVEE